MVMCLPGLQYMPMEKFRKPGRTTAKHRRILEQSEYKTAGACITNKAHAAFLLYAPTECLYSQWSRPTSAVNTKPNLLPESILVPGSLVHIYTILRAYAIEKITFTPPSTGGTLIRFERVIGHIENAVSRLSNRQQRSSATRIAKQHNVGTYFPSCQV